MSDKFFIFIFWAIVVGLVAWWGHGKMIEFQDNNRMEKQRLERETLTEQLIKNAVKSYGAVSDWSEKLEDPLSFSIQVQEALMPSNGAPIIIQGFLDDIDSKNGEYYISLHDFKSATKINFIINCDSSTEQILRNKDNQYKTFGIVAKIISVEKNTSSDSSANSDDFVAQGKCIAVIKDFP